MAKNVVIAIAGEIGSGKDHITNLISGYIGREGKPRFKVISIIRFADPIKKGIAGMFDHYTDFLYRDKNKVLVSEFKYTVPGGGQIKLTYGALQQYFGDAMRNIDKDIFCKIVVNKTNYTDKLVIIPDLRFSNELNHLKSKLDDDKKLILIKLIGIYDLKSKDNRDRNHESETEVRNLSINEFDYILNVNTYQGEDMKHMVKQILVKERIL